MESLLGKNINRKTWEDYWFIQATAWYLQIDIWIVATSCTENNPYIEISGNLGDGSTPCDGSIITMGSKSNSHYQSLRPIEMFHLKFRQNHQDPDIQISQARQMFTEMTIPVNSMNTKKSSEDPIMNNDMEKYNKHEKSSRSCGAHYNKKQ